MFCIKICFLEPESVRAELLLTEPDLIFLPGAGAEKNHIWSRSRGKMARLRNTADGTGI